MKLCSFLILGILFVAGVSFADGSDIKLPASCYTAAKGEALRCSSKAYPNDYITFKGFMPPLLYKGVIIVPVTVRLQSRDSNTLINVPVYPGNDGHCIAAKLSPDNC